MIPEKIIDMLEIQTRKIEINVPKALVVLVDRDQYAVALEYDKDGLIGPLVSVKGARELAVMIREVAKEYDIPLEENRILTRSLYAEVTAGNIAPENYWDDIVAIFSTLDWERLEKSAERTIKRQTKPQKIPAAPVDFLSLELGSGFQFLLEEDKAEDLQERIRGVRRETADTMGIEIPPVHIISNPRLPHKEYHFKLKGNDIGKGTIRNGYYLCINPGGVKEKIPGKKTLDPAFGLPAFWIKEKDAAGAKQAGYTVADYAGIIATHLTQIIKRNAAEFIDRQETENILKKLCIDYPTLVEEVKKNLSCGDIKRVLQALLREQVSIRNIVDILEALADYGSVSKDTRFLTEKARQSLSRQICLQYTDTEKKLWVITIEPHLAQKIINNKVETGFDTVSTLEDLHRDWIAAVKQTITTAVDQNRPPVILCSEAARFLVKYVTDREFPDLAVLSIREIPPDITVEQTGEIRINRLLET
jgi:flagellar biosynthesis protein FlhA